ncbi:AAA domain-containing protein [Aphelenchoides besseyi]|nr:AAA domain-containing protein [Aphelenchoides besseyi]
MTVSDCLNKVSARDNLEKVIDQLELRHLLDRQPDHLSGGELQRFAIAMCIVSKADVYLFDEPSSYLDVRQRWHDAKVINRHILHSKKTAFLVEHDLMMSTYLVHIETVKVENVFGKTINADNSAKFHFDSLHTMWD